MDIKNLEASDLPDGVYDAEVFDLFTTRVPQLLIVWLLNIKDGEFEGSRIENSYLANELPDLTASNFKAVGIDVSNLQSVLENPMLIIGRKIKVLVKSGTVHFTGEKGIAPVSAVKLSRIPF